MSTRSTIAVFLSLVCLLRLQSNANAIDAKESLSIATVRKSLRTLPSVSPKQLSAQLAAMASPDLKLAPRAFMKFVTNLAMALGEQAVTDEFALNWLVGDLALALNPGKENQGQVKGAISDFGSALKKLKCPQQMIDLVVADLSALVPKSQKAKQAEGPQHKYRYAISEAPQYDKSILVEDFEFDGELWKTWYQPGWSTGVVASVQNVFKSTGTRGLTLSHTGPETKYTSVAKIPRPPHPIAGMNAIRMWIYPHASGKKNTGDEGGVTTGIIDGSDEIWQMDVPDLLVGSEPFILQIRLADFKKTLRRNNGVIDLENRDFCFWMKGTYKFSVDDIRFVHDPKIPDFDPHLN